MKLGYVWKKTRPINLGDVSIQPIVHALQGNYFIFFLNNYAMKTVHIKLASNSLDKLCRSRSIQNVEHLTIFFKHTRLAFSSPEPIGSQGELIGWP